MKKFLTLLLFFGCVIFVFFGISNLIKTTADNYYGDNNTQYFVDTNLELKSKFVNSAVANDYLQLRIPVYTDTLCLNSAEIIATIYPDTNVMSINYVGTDFSFEAVMEDNAVYDFGYSLPENVSQYTYFIKDNTLFRIDWGSHLELAYHFVAKFYTYAENLTYDFQLDKEITKFKLPLVIGWNSNYNYIAKDYKKFVSYQDTTTLNWVNVGSNYNLVTSIFGGVSSLRFDVNFEIETESLPSGGDNSGNTDNGAGGGLGGGGTGSW